MAVINLTLGAVNQCPDIVFTDSTNYGINGIYNYFTIKLADGTTPNTDSTIESILVAIIPNSAEILEGRRVAYSTDGDGYVLGWREVYEYFVETINLNEDGFVATLVGDTKETAIVYVNCPEQFDGAIVTVGVTGAVLYVKSNVSNPTNLIQARNINITLPDGTQADLGAVAMEDVLTLPRQYYDVGSIFTFEFCGEEITYEVTEDNEADCVARGIVSALTSADNELFNKYITWILDANTITFKAKLSGVPFQLVPSYSIVSPTTYYTYTNKTANVSSMTVPVFDGTNTFTYTPQEVGGKYTATLTVVSDCDYNETTTEIFSWCYDLNSFECCLLNYVKSDSCCGKCSKKIRSASHINALIKVIEIMIANNHSEHEIQKIVNLAWSVCEGCKGCKGCK